jgi:NAD(P)-dependent dehydrogenase (short-subunit alcohol dehydrogenase family)
MGTNFMNYPGFRNSVGADDPKVVEKIKTFIPLGRLGEPKEAANLAAAVLDGTNMYTTGQVLSISGGWAGQ